MINYSKILIALLVIVGAINNRTMAATRLLAIMPNTEAFNQALSGLQSDLGNKYEVRSFDANLLNASDSLRVICNTFAPEGLVLMDSKAISLIKEIQKDRVKIKLLPKFVLMTLKVEEMIHDLNNVSGIKFEVPAYTIFTNLRSLTNREFPKVGVFYRQNFSAFIEESKKFLAKENIQLLGECLDCKSGGKLPTGAVVKGLKEGMGRLTSQNVNVMWMLADNTLVNEATLKGFWLSYFKDFNLPVVVPLPNLASLELSLGMFGVWPDYHQLGMQAAQQVIQVFESKENPDSLGLEPLISVQMILNLEMAKRARWDIKMERLDRVTTVLQKN